MKSQLSYIAVAMLLGTQAKHIRVLAQTEGTELPEMGLAMDPTEMDLETAQMDQTMVEVVLSVT